MSCEEEPDGLEKVPSNPRNGESQAADIVQPDRLELSHLRATVLEPFYRRIESDFNTIVHLRRQVADLQADALRKESNPDVVGERALIKHVSSPVVNKQASFPTLPLRQAPIAPTTKRKATAPPELQEDRHVKAGSITDHALANLACHVFERVRKRLDGDDCIEDCGAAAMSILLRNPRDALALAHKQLYSAAPEDVNRCWRRLFEEASLHLVTQLLHKQSVRAQPVTATTTKRVKLTGGVDHSWLKEIVAKLDQAIIIAGAPARRELIDDIFEYLDPIAQRTVNDIPQPLVRGLPPQPLKTPHAIVRPKVVMTPQTFKQYVDSGGNAVRPLVMKGVMADWPAMTLWDDLLYLKRHTMAGYRLVPVEIGTDYRERDWSQEIITFGEFAARFLMPETPAQTGYLAQYDIFRQIPTLRDDILIPEYCYSAPPPPTGAAARTKGYSDTSELYTPLINAWLGPKGTKSPLHTDPYHNILCQVVGWKYVRLYPPEESESVYPMGMDEAGIEMGNTSQVDVWNIRPRGELTPAIVAARVDMQRKFPRLVTADYVEALLGPGESLYIPLGWWHYVESLTTSISVSFWWN